jgi:hypothetical protein
MAHSLNQEIIVFNSVFRLGPNERTRYTDFAEPLTKIAETPQVIRTLHKKSVQQFQRANHSQHQSLRAFDVRVRQRLRRGAVATLLRRSRPLSVIPTLIT